MICEKCGKQFDDGLRACPYCDNAEKQRECDQPNAMVSEKESEPEKEGSSCVNPGMAYAKIERDEKGLIKRNGFRMKGVNYGPEFDEENMDHVFRIGIAFFVILAILLVVSFIVGVVFIVDR